MVMAIRVSLLSLLLISSANLTLSLYEDQLGLTDWHQQYIGKVKQAVFQTQKAGRKRVVVATEENVIASLDLRRGDIFWRHVLWSNDVIDEIGVSLGKYVVSLSSSGSILRAWNFPEGQLVWESFLQGSQPSKSLLYIPPSLKVDKDHVMLVFGNSCLYAVSSIDGEVLWMRDLAAESVKVQEITQPTGSNVVYVVGFSGSLQFDVIQIDIKNGDLLNHNSASLPGGFYGGVSLVSSAAIVTLDASRRELVSINFLDGEISFKSTDISDLTGTNSGEAVILPSKLTRKFALRINNHVVFVRLAEDGKLEFVEKVGHNVAVSNAISVSEDQQAFGLLEHSGSRILLSVKLDHEFNSDLIKESTEVDPQKGLVHKVFINNYIRTDRSYGFRALVVMEDHSLMLIQQGAIVWSREDGLASVLDVTTSELPVEKDGVSVAKVEHSLLEWLKGHILKIKGTLMLANAEEVAAIQAMRLKSSEKSKMTRDHNGFRKLLMVLTKAGKLYALHTGDGRIIWSLLVKSLRKSETCEHPTGLNVYQWQVPHHHALDENPYVLVVGQCANGLDAPGAFSLVDTYTGSEVNTLGLSHSVARVIQLPFTDSTEQRLHLILDSNNQVHLYPKTAESLGIFQREYQNIYWYSVEANASIIRGYALKSNCISELPDDFCFDSRNIWTIVFPVESEKIISTATRASNEVVHTQAKIIADQDVMYKYISNNILFVATVAPKASGPIGSATPEESGLVVYLIDTITGRILHRMNHYGAQGPVRAVLSENWVVYHYFNLRAHRYEMSVIEIYDQSRADNKNVWKLILGKHNLSAPVSSYSRPEIVTKSQSYFFTHSVKTIAVTSTAKGITSKQLLIGTMGDQILALDKRFLDPRRSVNPTQAEKEEGIIPLTDALPIIPQSYVTHALKVEGIRGVITAPAKLESTTHVFAYGVDLFYTRMAPSKTFDSLTEDFSYALLLLTIIILVGAIFATWILSERKELQDKWR
uniref:ER membrane protein complex subunit 1 n=1 Tax=Kalanchoe fedtschenkoi TaxID=63787 RepID=A0A7N1A0J8_KALFE